MLVPGRVVGYLRVMAERTQYVPGTFSWAELTSADQDGAKRFYSELFGWEAQDNPMGEGAVYSMMQLGGRSAAAISPQPQQQRDNDVPPMWNSYITVQSADDTLERARGLGANMHSDAFDVFDAGRMGVLQDPQGAFVCVWEPRENIGADIVNAPGALSWNELVTPDLEASAEFYGQLLGWTVTEMEGFGMPYVTIQNENGATNGGMRAAAQTEPTYWLVYFGCEDVDASLDRVQELGGNRVMDPLEIPTGKLAATLDPEGAVFALYSGQFAD